MKTISVREVAEALGISDRAVLYRREKGKLKGTLIKNERGVDEYRIYPTKEIIEGLKRINSPLVASHEAIESFGVVGIQTIAEEDKSFESNYVLEDTEVVVASDNNENRLVWLQNQREALREIAEEMIRPLVSQLEEKDCQLEEKEKQLQAATYRLGYAEGRMKDQEEQIKLLPDFQAQAEKAEQLKLEAEAAKARTAELEQNLAEAEKARLEEIQRISDEKEQQAKQLEEEIERLKQEREADARAIEELKIADAAKLAEKEAEAAAIKEHLQLLSATVEELKKPKPPWWQKWFTAPEPPAAK